MGGSTTNRFCFVWIICSPSCFRILVYFSWSSRIRPRGDSRKICLPNKPKTSEHEGSIGKAVGSTTGMFTVLYCLHATQFQMYFKLPSFPWQTCQFLGPNKKLSWVELSSFTMSQGSRKQSTGTIQRWPPRWGILAHQTCEDDGPGWGYQLRCSPPGTIKQWFPKNPESMTPEKVEI